MAKTMRMHGITVTHRDDGTWKISGRLDGKGSEKWEMIGDKFMLEGIPEASGEDVKKAEQILGIG